MRIHTPQPETQPTEPPALDYSIALLTAAELRAMDVPQRLKLLGEWMREADLGFVFAARGVGKTWLTMLIGNAVAMGTHLGEWTAGEAPRRVLYVDGEMSLADSQARTVAIGIDAPGFRWLHHQQLFDAKTETLNIASAPCQQAISALLESGDVLVLDNLSALARGVSENDNDAWEALLPWLLALRRRKVTVVVVHHAGRNGEMRGASRREDAADWVLRLRDDTADDDAREKAIVSTFTKCRGCEPKMAMPLRWTWEIRDGSLRYDCKAHSGADALAALVLGGIEKPSELAEILNVATGTVSKWAKKLEKGGRITIAGRKYLPPSDAPSGSD